MADSNKLISLNSILEHIRTHLMEWGDDATGGKIYSNSTGYLWGVIAETASQDYYLRINSNYFTFSNKIAESSTIDDTWKINANNIVTSATAPLSIATTTSSGVVTGAKISISAATASAAGSMSSADKTKLDKISVGADSATFGDSTTTALAIWGNSTNKVAISATNSSSGDGHRYAIRAQVDGIQLYDYSSGTSGSAVYKIYPTSGTSPISVSNGVVSISAATTSAAGSMSAADKKKLNQILVNTDTVQFYIGNAQLNNKTFGIWQNAGSALAFQGANETLDSIARVYFTSVGMPSSTAKADYISLSNYSTGSSSYQWRMFVPHYMKICRTSSGTLGAGNPRRFYGSLSEYKSSTGSSNYFEVTSDGGIKVLKAGNYRVSGSTGRIVAADGSGPITIRGTYVTKDYTTFDSSTFNENKLAEATTHGADEVVVAGPNIVHLAANEVVRLWGRQVGGGTATFAAVTANEASAIWLCVELISIDL